MGIGDYIPSQSIINNYLTSEEDITQYIITLLSCPQKYQEEGKSEPFLIAKCIINETKGNEETLRDLLKNISDYDSLINYIIDKADTTGIIKKLLIF